MNCPSCGAENREGAKFCVACGAHLVPVCPRCGTELPPGARFCDACGAQVTTTPTDTPITQALQRLVPREFADRLLAARGQVTSERRIVTILFSDVQGSTPMAQHLDPEEVLEVMDGAFDLLIAPITRYEGALARLMGDGILAFFGAPIAHEDDPERACRAALDILARARAYAARLQAERGIASFDVRVGIHTGLVVVGEVGSDLRVEYTAMGDAVNLASRMEETAEPGTVLITGDTHHLIAPLFETEALGPIEVRGRAEPVSAYRVLAAKPVVAKPRGIAGLDSPLVGRDAEMGALGEALERLQAGVGGIVTVVGEAGIGKSRLVAELRKVAAARDVRWVEGRCLSYGESMAYLPWVDMLRGLLGVSVEDAPLAVRDALRGWVQALCPDQVDEVYPFLARMMALPLDEQAAARLRGIEPEGLKVLTFRAVERAVASATKERPLALVCEDLHWADPTSLELLEHLLALTDRTSLLVISAFRPYREHGCWAFRELAARRYPHRHTDLWLNPLSTLDSETLVDNLLHVEALPRPLRMHILDHAEGNPFYVEEVIRSLIDSEAIVQDEATGHWQATRVVENIAIPDTLLGVLMARIDRLEEGTRRVLQRASVIGRIFPYQTLVAVAHEQELDAHLSTLQREEMIRERARLPEREYIFKHHLTQEAAYNGLLRSERTRLHRQVAEALERLLPDRVEEQLGLLAHHWEQAGERERAVTYLHRAGEQAVAQFANAEAVGHFTRALDLTPEEDWAGRYELLQACERVHDVQAAREAQAQDLSILEELAELLDDDHRRAEVALRQAWYAGRIGNDAERLALAQKAIRLGRTVNDLTIQASGHRLLAIAIMQEDRDEARSHFETALALARAAESRVEEASVLERLGLAHFYWGDFAASRTHTEQALHICREIGDRRGEGTALDCLGVTFLAQGEHDQARLIYEEELRICRETGDRWLEAYALTYLGFVYHQLGDYARAELYYRQASEIAGIHCLAIVSTYLGLLFHHLGDDRAAQDYAQQALAGGADAAMKRLAWCVLGHARMGQGRPSEAIDAYRRAPAQEREMGTMEALEGLARASLAQRDPDTALAHVEQILSYLEKRPLYVSWEPVLVYLTCHRVLRANDDPRADDILRQGYEFLQERVAKISDEAERRSFLENVAANREIAREYVRHRGGGGGGEGV